jgi:hypothetical protein
MLFVMNAKSMDAFVKARQSFVQGDYDTCLQAISNLATSSLVSKKAAVNFLQVFFPLIKQEKDSLALSDQVKSNMDGNQPLTAEEKKSLSLAASRGKYLLDYGKTNNARRWLVISYDLDKNNIDACCYLRDSEIKEEVVHPVYPVFEEVDL